YDIAFVRCIPNMVVATPSDEAECRLLLTTCYQYPGPATVRYPRGAGTGSLPAANLETVPLGKAVVRRERSVSDGSGVAILVFGTRLAAALEAAEALDATVLDMRFVKPIDREQILAQAGRHAGLVTIEEGCIMGGAGSAVCEVLNEEGVNLPVLQLGLPDTFIDHGDQAVLLAEAGLDAAGIEASVRRRFPVGKVSHREALRA